jgi:hypothetical protein
MNVPARIQCDVFVAARPDRRTPRYGSDSAKTGLKTAFQRASPSEAGWSRFCSSRHMETHRWLQRVAFLVLLLLLSAPAHARKLERLRPASKELRLLILSGMQRSQTFSALVDRLEASDLIVEVQCARFTTSRLMGRTALLSAQPSVRYVLVEIACPTTATSAITILGHELHHALEIASAPWVVDVRSLGRLYSQIGFATCGWPPGGFGEFETEDAVDAGDRVHYELFHPAASTRRVAQVITK